MLPDLSSHLNGTDQQRSSSVAELRRKAQEHSAAILQSLQHVANFQQQAAAAGLQFPVGLGLQFPHDMSAQAGLIGGGGLGDFAVSYGSQRYNWPVVYITVATIVVIVQLGQFLGNHLARRALRR